MTGVNIVVIPVTGLVPGVLPDEANTGHDTTLTGLRSIPLTKTIRRFSFSDTLLSLVLSSAVLQGHTLPSTNWILSGIHPFFRL